MTTIEVFAEITCPFAYVGLRHIAGHAAKSPDPVDIIVRSWPLEWVNGTGLAFDGVADKVAALREQLDLDVFDGLNADTWPSTTVPALGLAAAAYGVDPATGFDVSTELRTELFERGVDISDLDVLAAIAARHEIDFDPTDDSAVRSDLEEGRARDVTGSPHFFVGGHGFFCPSLDLGRDADDHLIARFDPSGLAAFLESAGLSASGE